MNTHRFLLLALGLAPLAPAMAAEVRPGAGLEEIPDEELGQMRGRYTVGDNAVAWFGVTMVSTWHTADGQVLQGAMTLGLDFGQQGAPRVSFTPSVSITAADAPLPQGEGVRGIEAAGLRNVAGLVQSVQVAGDGNRARNVARLDVRQGQAPAMTGGGASSASEQAGGASAQVSYDQGGARLLLQVEGQGRVEQWIGAGSVGQGIQLAGDDQWAGNHLQIDLLRSSINGGMPLSQNVAQAITLSRGIGPVGL